jgi:hypothetical protein
VERVVVGEPPGQLGKSVASRRIGAGLVRRERPERQQRLGAPAQALDVFGV